MLVNSNATIYWSAINSGANLSSTLSQSTGMSNSLHGYFLLSLPGVMFALELSLQATAYSTLPVKYSWRSVCVQIMRVQ